MNSIGHVAFAFKNIAFTDASCLNGAANLKYVIWPNHQNWLFVGSRRCTSPNIMDDRCVLFQKAVLADNYWTGYGKNRDPWMDDTAAGNGDVTAEDAILVFTDRRLGPDFQPAWV